MTEAAPDPIGVSSVALPYIAPLAPLGLSPQRLAGRGYGPDGEKGRGLENERARLSLFALAHGEEWRPKIAG